MAQSADFSSQLSGMKVAIKLNTISKVFFLVIAIKNNQSKNINRPAEQNQPANWFSRLIKNTSRLQSANLTVLFGKLFYRSRSSSTPVMKLILDAAEAKMLLYEHITMPRPLILQIMLFCIARLFSTNSKPLINSLFFYMYYFLRIYK